MTAWTSPVDSGSTTARGGCLWIVKPSHSYARSASADVSALRRAGYTDPFVPLEEGTTRSVAAWEPVSIGDQAVA